MKRRTQHKNAGLTRRIFFILNYMVLVLIFVLMISLTDEAHGAAGGVIIMPLGDSITSGWGSSGLEGYRRSLYLSLYNYSPGYVGSQSEGQRLDFDRDHEGHSGWMADQIRDNIFNWLVTNPADIILLHIGTNDIAELESADNVIVEIEQILDMIAAFDPDIMVFLAQIINRSDPNGPMGRETTLLNSKIQLLAENRSNVLVVDMENALTYPDDLDDDVHPNDIGYQKMAEVWFSALDNYLSCNETGQLSIIPGQTLFGNSIDLTSILTATNALNAVYSVRENGSSLCDIGPNGTYIEAENFTDTIHQEATFVEESVKEDHFGSGYLKTLLPAGHTIFSTQTLPADDYGADSAVENGVKWTSDINGWVVGVRFYKSSRNTGAHKGRLWQGTTLLATASFLNETSAGWQYVYFDTPVAVTAGTTYIVSYHSVNGYYYQSDDYFGAIDNAPLHISAAAGENGVYRYAAASSFECAPMPCTPASRPTTNYNANFWVDVIFAQSLPSCSGIAGREYKKYEVDFPAGTYTVWLRGYAEAGADTMLVGVDGSCMGTYRFNTENQWAWSNTAIAGTNSTGALSAAPHHIDIWTRQANVSIDGIYMTTGTETPTDISHGVTVDPSNCGWSLFSGDELAAQSVDTAGWTEGMKYIKVTGDDLICGTPLTDAIDTFTFTASVDYYCDIDLDGHIALSVSGSCTGAGCGPAGCQTVAGADCDDNDLAIHPGAADICDGKDNDCTSGTADGSGETAPLNTLQYGVCAGSAQSCIAAVWTDDYSEVSSYEATESTCDSLDNDCDSAVDEGLTTTYYQDSDGDTYGNTAVTQAACSQPERYLLDNTDCDDTDPYIYPDGKPVRVVDASTSYHLKLQAAYYVSLNGSKIQSKNEALPLEDININQSKLVRFEGGHNCSYTINTGTTTINGNMTISDGTVIISSGTYNIQ